jgi:hypothetical protein
MASELALCYHNVKHSIIYNSFDYNTQLSHHLFSNSKAGSKLLCRRRKADVLVSNILAYSSVTDILETL